MPLTSASQRSTVIRGRSPHRLQGEQEVHWHCPLCFDQQPPGHRCVPLVTAFYYATDTVVEQSRRDDMESLGYRIVFSAVVLFRGRA